VDSVHGSLCRDESGQGQKGSEGESETHGGAEWVKPGSLQASLYRSTVGNIKTTSSSSLRFLSWVPSHRTPGLRHNELWQTGTAA
jgi:hypothetical protein